MGRPPQLDLDFYQRLKQERVQDWELLDAPCGLDTSASPLAAGTYQITQIAERLLAIVGEALQRACGTSEPAEAEALCGVVPAICTMLRTLPPVVCPELSALPKAALLHVNDLQHCADQLLLLPASLSPWLHRAARGEVNFWQDAIMLRYPFLVSTT